MEVTCEEEEFADEEGCVLWMLPPSITLCSLVQLEPFWPFFMVAGGEEEKRNFRIRCVQLIQK